MEFLKDELLKEVGKGSSEKKLEKAAKKSLEALLHQLISSDGIDHEMYLGERPELERARGLRARHAGFDNMSCIMVLRK